MLIPTFGEGNGEEQMYRFFSLNLPDVLNDSSTFDTIFTRQKSDPAALLHPTKLPWKRKDSLTFLLPGSSNDVSPFDSTDCTLFIQDIFIYGKSLFNYNVLLLGKGGFNIKPLRCYALYALWDNKEKKPITWGKFSSGRQTTISQCDWVLLLHELAGTILKGTPYKKRYLTQTATHDDLFEPKIKDCSIKK